MLRPDGEPFLFTVLGDGGSINYSFEDPNINIVGKEGETVLETVLNHYMRKHSVMVTHPNEEEFVGAIPESHRKGEKAYHVKAFRGSKDGRENAGHFWSILTYYPGFLFFLQTGIFFGFKKPLLWFDFDSIESISYTSVLQRTFNLNISYKPKPDADPEEIEFSMLDQADFAGIDAYIKRHELQDASMADARRAKKLNINKNRGEVSTEKGANKEEDDRTELQKAEAELEDAEDEEEEDYDPGSEGDSEGSGSDTDDEEDVGNGQHGERDIVGEELGSEAEDVDVDPDDDDQL